MKSMVGALGALAALGILGALTLGAAPALADPAAASARLEQIPAAYLVDHRFMGAVLVARDGHVLLDRGYGFANLDWEIPDAPDVKFRIGSITKQFTAALVLLLQQDGKLSVEDRVSKYLPDAPKAWADVTVFELLHHASGIPDFTEDPRFAVWSASPHSPTDFLELVKDKPLVFAPGSRYAYSNTNFEVLGAIIETATGQSWAQVLKSRLLSPLGLSGAGVDADDLILPKRASGYRETPAGPVHARSESMSVPGAAGAMYATTHDLYAWDLALFGGKVLSPASLAAMTTPGKGDYGMGLEVGRHAGSPLIAHGGGIEGFISYLAWDPEDRIIVVVLSNDESQVVPGLALKLLDVAAGRPVVLPSERKAVAIEAAELKRFVGTFTFEGQPEPIAVLVRDGRLVWGRMRRPLTYVGLRHGRPLFWDQARDLEVEFVTDETGAVNEVVVDGGAATSVGRRSGD